VADTGVGIPPDEQERVFDKFRQAAASTLTRDHEGTGLGLSIVRELCGLLGGEVTLQSDLGLGSTFTVRLPRVLTVPAPIRRLEPAPRADGRHTPTEQLRPVLPTSSS
jgi:signal transduction histidine kinase